MKNHEILIIDDDLEDVMLLKEALKHQGQADTHSETNAKKALSYLENEDRQTLPKLIIVDVSLPDIDGRQFVDILNNSNKFKDIPLILISTIKLSAHRIKNNLPKGVKFFQKPYYYEQYLNFAGEIVGMINKVAE